MDEPNFEQIPLQKLELWDDANVRKSEVVTNMDDLAGNIKKNGLRVPLLVKQENDKYLVFSGQRRLIACRAAKLTNVPCFVFPDIGLHDAMVLSLSENLYREAMTKEDKSRAANTLFTKFKDMSRVAKALGVSENTVWGYFTYDAIPEDLKKFARRGGNLSAKQVEDIYMKFPDVGTATSVAEQLSKIEDRTKKRKMHAAIRQSIPSDDISTIEKRAEKMLHEKTYTIILPDNDYMMIEKVAHARRIDEEDLLIEIVEGWIREYNEGRHR